MNNNLNILKSDLLRLPKIRSIRYMPDYFSVLFKQYLEAIEKFDDNEGSLLKDEISKIETLCNSIIESSRLYLTGHPSLAYSELERGLSSIEAYLLAPRGNGINFSKSESLYRIRLESNATLTKKEDLFHIPFQSRHLVKSQRFSIPGLPCLYLSNSIYC